MHGASVGDARARARFNSVNLIGFTVLAGVHCELGVASSEKDIATVFSFHVAMRMMQDSRS